MTQAKPKTVNLNVILSVEADELLRSHCRRKGDISRLVEEAIIAKFKPSVSEPYMPST